MDIAFEQNEWSQALVRSESDSGLAHPDWHGLCARLVASQQARQALAAEVVTDLAVACGSFDRDAAQRISAFGDALRAVNLDASANRNPDGDIDTRVAGTTISGIRG